MGFWERNTKTITSPENDDELFVEEKSGTEEEIEEVVETTPSKKKRKFKLTPRRVAVTVVGVASLIAIFNIGKSKVEKYNAEQEIQKEVSGYERIIDNEEVRTSNFYQLINETDTSLDEIINADKEEYEAYEKYRTMLTLQNQFIESKREDLRNYESVEINYDSIDADYLNDLNAKYYEYYNAAVDCSGRNDMIGYDYYMEKFNDICVKMNSADICINAYSEKYGHDLVSNIASKVLASKTVDFGSKDIIPATVHDVEGTYKDDSIDISYGFSEYGKAGLINTSFDDDNYLINRLIDDVQDQNDLDAIYTTKAIVLDYKEAPEVKESVDFQR